MQKGSFQMGKPFSTLKDLRLNEWGTERCLFHPNPDPEHRLAQQQPLVQSGCHATQTTG